LLRWGSWFAVVNAAVLAVIGLRYLWYYSPLQPLVGWTYAGLAYAGHLSALAYIPLILLVPVMMLVPRPWAVLPLAVLVSSVILSFLLLDSLVFAENRYHLGVLTFSLLERQTWAFLFLYFLLGLAVEAMVAAWIWRRTAFPGMGRIGWYLPLGLGACLLASNLIHAWAEAHYYPPVTAFTRYLPLYQPRTDRGLVRLGLVDRTRAREQGVAGALLILVFIAGSLLRRYRWRHMLLFEKPVHVGLGVGGILLNVLLSVLVLGLTAGLGLPWLYSRYGAPSTGTVRRRD